MNLDGIIEPSIFETNRYLIKNKPTLIEYAAFYGSIQIFQYVKLNGVSLNPFLWFYVIHGNNPEMIHLLEENHVPTIFYGSYSKCLEASIQFHNKNVIEYVLDNIIKEVDLLQEERNSYSYNMLSYSFHYINFAYFPQNNNDYYNNNYILFYLCQYNYYNLVVLYQQIKKVNLNETVRVMDVITYLMNFNSIFAFCLMEFQILFLNNSSFDMKPVQLAAYFGNFKIVNFLDPNFRSTESKIQLKAIIPSSQALIKEKEFYQFSFLKKVLFEPPSSIESIQLYGFTYCIRLSHIILPSSLTKIEDNAFENCEALKFICFEKPSSLIIIGKNAFRGCLSLEELSIPSSVMDLGKNAFYQCSSLKNVYFENPSSLETIKTKF